MPGKHRCGIYVIEQTGTERYYIGSSANIENRWYAHRHQLNAGMHHSRFLQNAWTKHGSTAFRFYVIEECDRADLIDREQEYFEALQPIFNVCSVAGSRLGVRNTPEGLVNVRRAIAERVAKIIACPKGHPYDDANTYRSDKAGKRICRACNTERVRGVYAVETPEQREERRQRVRESHQQHREERLAKQAEYVASHKEQKHAYDQSRVALTAERQKERRANRTPEQMEAVREAKRAAYWRDRDKNVQDLRERYRRTHPISEPATACKAGHPYTDESVDSKGMRLCKTCRAISKRAYRDRLKAAATP